jgi:hypothetical protein
LNAFFNIFTEKFIMKHFTKIISLFILLQLSSCAELQNVVNNLPQEGLSNTEIASGLKEALNKGIDKEVSKLMAPDGFFNDKTVKILLPDNLQKVDKALRDIGLSQLADQGLLLLNRAASDAVKEAKPIFVDAITNMSFDDAKNILLGGKTAATDYLKQKTASTLYKKFTPQVQQSLHKVNADKVWNDIITKYNQIPFVNKVNPDLTDYVTNKAMDGVFVKVAVEEQKIRTDFNERTSDLLKKVFALQDGK